MQLCLGVSGGTWAYGDYKHHGSTHPAGDPATFADATRRGHRPGPRAHISTQTKQGGRRLSQSSSTFNPRCFPVIVSIFSLELPKQGEKDLVHPSCVIDNHVHRPLALDLGAFFSGRHWGGSLMFGSQHSQG